MSEHIKLGKIGEQIAAHFLVNKGYEILVQNYWTRLGEIDIVAKIDDKLVFVEVKTKTSTMHGEPHQAVTPEKIQKMMAACRLYCQEFPLGDNFIRLDAISIVCDRDAGDAYVQHFENITQ
ncbi:MAG: hypothetical protein CMI52_01255 [Parcubacteria group bacterium]|nr:hypothetical protein [Parcubacteria group bacterium]|tara:strand:+ start:1289 stop:1651 length:363 start_codon:yes stop_codon:yes gene_type:complete